MQSNEQTALLPKQRLPVADEHLVATEVLTPARDPSPGPRDVPPGSHDSSDGFSGRVRALTTLAWMLPTAVMAVLGLVRLNWSSLSASELDYRAFAVTPWDRAGDLLEALGPNRVAYYVALKGWASVVGTSDLSLRLLSVIAMVLATALIAGLGARLATPRTGIIAGLLFIIVPTTSLLAQEIGPYGWTICLATLSTFALVSLLDRGGVWRYLAYTPVVALLGLLSPIALLVLVAHGVAVCIMRAAAFAGWLLAAVGGVAPTVALFWWLGAPRMDISWRSPVELPDPTSWAGDVFGAVLLGGAIVGLGLLSASLRKPAVIATTWTLIPAVVLYAAGRLGFGWSATVLAFTLGGWALLGAHALNRAPVVRGVLAGMILGALCLPTQIDIRQRAGHGLASAELGAIVAGQAQKGDVIVYGPTARGARTGRDIVARYVPQERRPKDVLALHPARTDGKVLVDECPQVDRCLARAPRVWLVRTDRPLSPLAGLPTAKETVLTTFYDVDKTWYLTGLLLARLTLKPSAPDQPTVG